MNIFKHRHFKYDIIIWAVRWYCKYGDQTKPSAIGLEKWLGK